MDEIIDKKELEALFNMPSFYDMFITLNAKYHEFQFTDNISDSERISEYTWITQQYRKYITRQQDVILKHNKRSDMLREIADMISKANEYGTSRKEIIYNALRDEFLVGIYHIIELYVAEDEDEGQVE